MVDRFILAECYGDTLLLKQLKVSHLEYHSGIGEVANQMQRYFHNRFALAIIDGDKNKPSYFNKDCKTIQQKGQLTLLKHNKQNHYVIVINPAFEEYIYLLERECKIDSFEKDKKKFTAITKDRTLHKNQRFINHLNRIIQKAPKSLVAFQQLIKTAQKQP